MLVLILRSAFVRHPLRRFGFFRQSSIREDYLRKLLTVVLDGNVIIEVNEFSCVHYITYL